MASVTTVVSGQSYQILAASYSKDGDTGNPSYCLDVKNGSKANHTTVQIEDIDYSNPQVWTVTKMKTGYYEILSRYLGKALDIAKDDDVTSGFDIEIDQDKDTLLQRWQINELSGKTCTYNNVEYQIYTVTNAKKTGLALDIEKGSADKKSGSAGNVQAKALTGNKYQQWIFIPVPKFRAGGAYEIRTYLSPTKLALDCTNGSTSNGTNVQVSGVNDHNAQKFYIDQEIYEDHTSWSIRNIGSGKDSANKKVKYVDVANGQFKNGTNVQLYQDNDTRSQRWQIIEKGTLELKEKVYAVVEIACASKTGTTSKYRLDVSEVISNYGINVQIYESNDSDAQKWVLVPTTAVDHDMPTPYDLLGAYEKGGDGKSRVNQKNPLYLTWSCSDAWVTDGANSYRIRYRTRKMKSSKSSWQNWSDWTKWKTAGVYIKKKQAWWTNDLDVSYEFANYKNMQVEFQVRSQADKDDAGNVVSEIADQVLNVARVPTMTIDSAVWSYDGLHITYTSDYTPYGSVYFNMTDLKFTKKDPDKYYDALSKHVSVRGRRGTALIPNSYLKKYPKYASDTDTGVAMLEFKIGTDQYDKLKLMTRSTTVSKEGGSVDMTTTVDTGGKGLIAEITVDKANTVRCWAIFGSKVIELTGTVSNGSTIFKYAYPFDTTFDIMTSYISDSNSAKWAVNVEEDLTAPGGINAHAWNWDDGAFVLWLTASDGGLTEARSYSTQSEEQVLVGRRHPAVSFLSDAKGRNFTTVSSTIEGVMIPGDNYDTSLKDFEALLEQGHVTYRGPRGRTATVAVTSGEITKTKEYVNVSITQTEEQL